MGQVCNYCHVPTLQVAPVLASILPNPLVVIGLVIVTVRYSEEVAIVICFHEWATSAFFILCVVCIIADVDLIVLEVLVLVCVLVRCQSVV